MANERLPMRKIKDALRLEAQGLSGRQIATSLQLGRTTVKRYLLRAKLAGLTWPLPDALTDEELELLLFPVNESGEKKQPYLPDWKAVHKECRKPNVTLALLWEEYRAEHSKGYGYSQYCRLYRGWRGKLSPSMRQTHVAGEKLFVDYSGTKVPILDPKTGEIREAELFVATLGASNFTYAEATWSQSLSDWTGSHCRAFAYFGGVTSLVVPDNLKSGIIKACFFEPAVNRTYADLIRHYGTAVLPARPYKPKDKAKVEVAVQIAQRWILGRLRKQTFTSLEELNAAIREPLDRLNDKVTKHLGTSRRQLFAQLDQPALKPLPAAPYSFAQWEERRVGLDYHIKIDDHFYSVPHQLLRKKLWARFTEKTVEAFDRGKRVACHMRSQVKGGHTTARDHMPSAHRRYAEWTPQKLTEKAGKIGPNTSSLIEIIMREKPHPEQGFRAGIGIIGLAKSFGTDRVENACTRALEIGARTFTSVKSILNTNLDRRETKKAADAPAISHQNIRGPNYFH